jgi:hypothetical protein
VEGSRMFGCEYGAATSRTGLQRLGKDDPRHPSRDEAVVQMQSVELFLNRL